jgi:hypothetical protein
LALLPRHAHVSASSVGYWDTLPGGMPRLSRLAFVPPTSAAARRAAVPLRRRMLAATGNQWTQGYPRNTDQYCSHEAGSSQAPARPPAASAFTASAHSCTAGAVGTTKVDYWYIYIYRLDLYTSPTPAPWVNISTGDGQRAEVAPPQAWAEVPPLGRRDLAHDVATRPEQRAFSGQ